MTIGVGLCVGNDHAAAAVAAPGKELRTLELPATISTSPDGTVQLGEPAAGATDVVEGVMSQAGVAGGIEYGGTMTRPEDLVATALFCLFREVAQGLAADVKIAAAHPASWDTETVTALRESLDYMGLTDAVLVPDTDALAATHDTMTPTTVSGSSGRESRELRVAQGTALIAAGLVITASTADAATDAIPVVGDDSENMAYSAVLPQVPATPAAATPAAAATKPDRRPLLVGTASAVALLLGGALIVAALQLRGSNEVVETHEDASPTTSFPEPTLVPREPTTTEATTTTTTPAPRPTTSRFVPPPPPPPPPPPAPTTTLVPTTTTTPPPTTTTTTPPPTTTTEPTTPTEDPTETDDPPTTDPDD
ncbi:MAG: hypothetical protein GX542_14020 [Rhodococcus sp.]|nr:hypothetical protein [Rhodococcus sp. (in: high G+C Gram-positive bacteria)]